MNRLLGLVAGAVLLAGGAYYYSTQSNSTAGLLPGAANAQSTTADSVEIQEMFLGSETAPITVVEYASYTCPHCARFHEGAFKQLKTDFIDTGKVKFVYREVYFDRPGLWASMLARCGGETRFFGISDMLYSQQRQWTASGDPAQIAEALRKIGRTAGMDDATLDACLTDATKAQSLIAWFEENAAEDGIRSTPSFIIDGKLHSNMAYSEFAELLNDKLN
ncbi:DsbA family protein [Algirhabdus cladophorae]|uniref:DsbA family protein n=1 Tax=Algirhabdus cladophorae TaxID=3377108 RepID=UPI003B8455F9